MLTPERIRQGILARLREFEKNGTSKYCSPMNGVSRACWRYFMRVLRGEANYLEISLPRADSILQAHYRSLADRNFNGLHPYWVDALAAIVLYLHSEYSTFAASRQVFLLLADDLLGLGSYEEVSG